MFRQARILTMAAAMLGATAFLVACGSSSESSSAGNADVTTTMDGMSQAADCRQVTTNDTRGGGMGAHGLQRHNGTAATVNVTLKEWSIDVDAHALGKGTEHMSITNTGAETHELGVVKGDRSTLTPKADGSIDETKFAVGALAGRMIVPAGKTCELDVVLDTGTYTLFCNMVETMGAEQHVHYANGMWAEVAAF